jgi:hypothetical protein
VGVGERQRGEGKGERGREGEKGRRCVCMGIEREREISEIFVVRVAGREISEIAQSGWERERRGRGGREREKRKEVVLAER